MEREPLNNKNQLFILYAIVSIVLIYISFKYKNLNVNENDWVIILTNVLFFTIVQILFFKFVASKQYENVLVSKLDIIKRYSQKNPDFKELIDKNKQNFLETNNIDIQKQRKEREKKNYKLIIDYCSKPIAISIFALILILVISKTDMFSSILNIKKTNWNDVYTLGLIFVLLAYGTEILFFLFIVKKYEFVGDFYILNNLFKQI
jgi:hypothetical protein